jgi:hypothetical protein
MSTHEHTTSTDQCNEWEWTPEQIERRNARDRILAREVGIEIGRRREAVKHERRASKSFTRGLATGILLIIIIYLIGLAGADYASAKTIRIGSGDASQRVTYKAAAKDLPPGWETFLEICKREQPAKGWGWGAVAWKQTYNSSYAGGCGLTTANYLEVRHYSWPDSAHMISPRDQLWASFWLYWKHARIGQAMLGSYQSGQRYGSTVWDVHDQPGLSFHGFGADGKTPATR